MPSLACIPPGGRKICGIVPCNRILWSGLLIGAAAGSSGGWILQRIRLQGTICELRSRRNKLLSKKSTLILPPTAKRRTQAPGDARDTRRCLAPHPTSGGSSAEEKTTTTTRSSAHLPQNDPYDAGDWTLVTIVGPTAPLRQRRRQV